MQLRLSDAADGFGDWVQISSSGLGGRLPDPGREQDHRYPGTREPAIGEVLALLLGHTGSRDGPLGLAAADHPDGPPGGAAGIAARLDGQGIPGRLDGCGPRADGPKTIFSRPWAPG